MSLCVVCNTNPVIETNEKPTCYNIECQLMYNEKHNINTKRPCRRCGRHTTSKNGECSRCKNSRKIKN